MYEKKHSEKNREKTAQYIIRNGKLTYAVAVAAIN